MAYTDILAIAFIYVFLLDISDGVDALKRFLWNRLFKNVPYPDTGISIKPFDCSLCLTWWTSLLYIVVTNNISFTIVCYVAIISSMTTTIRDIYCILQNILQKILKKIYE